MLESIPWRAPLLFGQLLFPGVAATVVLVEAGLLFCFPSTWKKNKTGLMKNTHGKCFILSSSSPTALWHCSVLRKDLSLTPACSLSEHWPVGWYEADTVSFPVRSFQRNLLLFPLGHFPLPHNPPSSLPPRLSIGHMPHGKVVLISKCSVLGSWEFLKLWAPNTINL